MRVAIATLGAVAVAATAWPSASAASPPGAPTGLTGKVGIGSALIMWTPPVDTGGSAITGYLVTAATMPSIFVPAPATSTLLTGLPAALTVVAVEAVNAAGAGPAAAFQIRAEPGGTFHALSPSRILDTRDGTGGVPARPIGPGGTLSVQVAGRGGVPATAVSAIVLNVTVTNTTAASFLTVYPTGVARPLVSNLNWVGGQTVPNLVTVALGSGGQVDVYSPSGSVDVIFDVAGWVGDSTNSTGPEGMFNSLAPARLFDSRSGFGPIFAGGSIDLQVTGRGGVPPTGVSAVVLNVTVTNPTASSFLTVWPTGTTRPLASNLNFTAGQTVPNRVIVKVGAGGQISIFNLAGRTDVVVDVNGWFTDATNTSGGSGLAAAVPARVFDSRTNGSGPLHGGSSVVVDTFSGAFPPTAVIVNITATDATAASFLTVWPYDGSPQPPTSDLNFVAGQTVPNATIVRSSVFWVFNSAGSVDVVVDVDAFFGAVVQPLTAANSVASTRSQEPGRYDDGLGVGHRIRPGAAVA